MPACTAHAGWHGPKLLAIFKFSACYDTVDCLTKWIFYGSLIMRWLLGVKPPLDAWTLYHTIPTFNNPKKGGF